MSVNKMYGGHALRIAVEITTLVLMLAGGARLLTISSVALGNTNPIIKEVV